jgi:hypothetical protein
MVIYNSLPGKHSNRHLFGDCLKVKHGFKTPHWVWWFCELPVEGKSQFDSPKEVTRSRGWKYWLIVPKFGEFFSLGSLTLPPHRLVKHHPFSGPIWLFLTMAPRYPLISIHWSYIIFPVKMAVWRLYTTHFYILRHTQMNMICMFSKGFCWRVARGWFKLASKVCAILLTTALKKKTKQSFTRCCYTELKVEPLRVLKSTLRRFAFFSCSSWRKARKNWLWSNDTLSAKIRYWICSIVYERRRRCFKLSLHHTI